MYKFNGVDPFDDWTIKDGCLYGYYPRNSLINILSKSNSVRIDDDSIYIPNIVAHIKNSCFKNNKRCKQVFIPDSVKHIDNEAFDNTNLILVVVPGSYGEEFAIRKGLKYKLKENDYGNK